MAPLSGVGPFALPAVAGLVAGVDAPVEAATAQDAARFGELVVVTIPCGHIGQLPEADLRDKVVMDTCNCYPERDGRDVELDDDSTTSSEKVLAAISGNIVKTFNAMY